MWKVINASVIGTSHLDSGTACQDRSIVAVVTGENGDPYLVCLAADGAGSAAKGGRGAELTCTTGMAFLTSAIQDARRFNTDLIAEVIAQIRSTIFKEAQKTKHSSRDYACTFIGAVLGNGMSIFFQIGDGAVVVSKNNTHGVVFWPDAGPYANMTHFITDDDAFANLHIESSNTCFDGMAILSDGLQYLALVFKQQIPHVPFFHPMLETLGKIPRDNIEDLRIKLVRFLGSRDVNERTDDDKTLILAAKADE
jgi:hypothetical protein